MKRAFRIGLLLLLLLTAAGSLVGNVSAAGVPREHIDVLTVKGDVNPVLADYLARGIDTGNKDGATLIVILLDTPGGLISSTQDIVAKMMDSDVPIAVLVTWAGSAGTFITLAADVAAMQPVSRIGAASPISEGGEAIDPVLQSKLFQDTAAFIESIAADHGRNTGAATAAVIKAASYTSAEALGKDAVENASALGIEPEFLRESNGEYFLNPPLVDVEARSLDDLLNKIDAGITRADGKSYSIPLASASIKYVNMSAAEKFLYAVANPNIAYILMSLAMTAIIIEISSPGVVIPGVVGGICLLLAIYGLGVLNANFAGVGLIILAFILFVAELFTPGTGALAIGGGISLILGSLVLFRGTPFSIHPGVIAATVLIFVAIFGFLIFSIVRVQRRPITTGKEALVGLDGIAATAIDPVGQVMVNGERWRARTEDDRIQPGEEVKVTRVEKLELTVVKGRREAGKQ